MVLKIWALTFVATLVGGNLMAAFTFLLGAASISSNEVALTAAVLSFLGAVTVALIDSRSRKGQDGGVKAVLAALADAEAKAARLKAELDSQRGQEDEIREEDRSLQDNERRVTRGVTDDDSVGHLQQDAQRRQDREAQDDERAVKRDLEDEVVKHAEPQPKPKRRRRRKEAPDQD